MIDGSSLFARLFAAYNVHASLNTSSSEYLLTFDDGPNPSTTPAILECLSSHGVSGMFFCLGKNVRRYPYLYGEILAQGHRVGNHTEDHINGWFCKTSTYVANVGKAAEVIQSKLFRPPYGKITPSQLKALDQLGYFTYLWSILTRDYDANFSLDASKNLISKSLRAGSILVFHDSDRAKPKLIELLSFTLNLAKERNLKSALN